jgi:hypothetical protein
MATTTASERDQQRKPRHDIGGIIRAQDRAGPLDRPRQGQRHRQ